MIRFGTKWFKWVAQFILGTVVLGLIFNLITDEILSDSRGWFHALYHSRLLAWLLLIISIMIILELLASRNRPVIKVRMQKTIFQFGGWVRDMPLPPFTFLIFLDILNKGDAIGYINSIEVENIDTGTNFLTTSSRTVPCKTFIGDSFVRRRQWPITVNPGSRVSNLRLDITVELSEISRDKFASLLSELREYNIILKYEWEGVRGSIKRKKLHVKGNFARFKNRVADKWRKRGYSDLLELYEGNSP